MKSKNIIYPVFLFMVMLLPTVRYYISTPGINDCMTHYVQQMKFSNYQGLVYNINGAPHIEPKNSTYTEALDEYVVGKANGCIIQSEDIFSSFNNTVYCSVTYIIQNAPIATQLKQPLALFDGGAI